MSGHSKWSKVKHQKETTDKSKGRLYTVFARKIAISAREGKGLQQVVDQAKAASVPKDVIARAIEKAAKNINSAECVKFEAFFLNGKVGLIILATTDNNTRTSNEVRHVIEKHGGKFGAPGTASYLFNPRGEFMIDKTPRSMDLILESGAEDFREQDGQIIIESRPDELSSVATYFKDHQIEITPPEIVYEPLVKITLSSEENQQLSNLIDDIMSIEGIDAIYDNAF